MIKKLKIKFIALSMTALFILLLVIVSGMNLLNFNSVMIEADQLLQVLSQNKGDFPSRLQHLSSSRSDRYKKSGQHHVPFCTHLQKLPFIVPVGVQNQGNSRIPN